jgi:glucan phosphoethanolaminetransferase (alkaline phosphatase superfamily)
MRKGISASTTTKDSLALLFNSVLEGCNLKQVRSGEANIFRIAKLAGYKTYFITAQDSGNIDGQSVRHIDVLESKETNRLGIVTKRDEFIFDHLKKIDLEKGGNFIVFFSRAIHSPYERAYQFAPQFRVWSEDKTSRHEFIRNTYDNAVLYADDLFARVINAFKERDPGPTSIFITADHGEMLGDNGDGYGHIALTRTSLEIPFIYYAIGGVPKAIERFLDDDYVTHYELARLVARKMGFDIVNPNARPGEFFANGANIYQECKFIRITKSGADIEFGDE